MVAAKKVCVSKSWSVPVVLVGSRYDHFLFRMDRSGCNRKIRIYYIDSIYVYVHKMVNILFRFVELEFFKFFCPNPLERYVH